MVVIWVPETDRTQNNLSIPPLATIRPGAGLFTPHGQGLLSHLKNQCMCEFTRAWEMDRDYAYVPLYSVPQSRAWDILSTPYLWGIKQVPHMEL